MRGNQALGSRFAAATPHAAASSAAADIFAEGGSAADAAIAAAAVLAVVYPHQCSVGGDVIALVASPTLAPTVVNASGAAPAAWRADEFSRRHGPLMPWYGVDTITVPGAVSGWSRLHELAGVLPWRRLLEPAMAAASDGVPVAPGLSRAIAQETGRIIADEGLRSVFAPDGHPLAAGQALRQPQLARSLGVIAAHGSTAFYDGELGADLIAGLNRRGSLMTRQDLADHSCEVVESVSSAWGDDVLHVAPPNSQGLVLAQMCAALEVRGLSDPLEADADWLTWLFLHATRQRNSWLADPRSSPVDVDYLRSDEFIGELVELASNDRTPIGSLVETETEHQSGDTVALTTADSDGGFVSLIESVYMSFGSGVLEPKTGILLHDRGACFSLDESSPNACRGGSRPAHTLMPVLLERDGRVYAAHGTRGGSAQPQIHMQVLLQLARGLEPGDAVAHPRWIASDEDRAGEELFVEEDLPAVTLDRLSSFTGAIHRLPHHDDAVGHIQVVRSTANGLVAASDPRADGAAVAG